MKYKAIIFDLDNTLIRKRPSVPEKGYELLKDNHPDVSQDDLDEIFANCEFLVGVMTSEEKRTGVHISDDEFLTRLMSLYQEKIELSEIEIEWMKDVWMGNYTKVYEMDPDAGGLLDALQQHGYILGIVSNNASAIREQLSRADLERYFSTIVISDEVGVAKPDPEILLLAAECLGVLPEESLYVGDHPFDVVCAHAAGMDAVWKPINRHFRLPEEISKPEYAISSLLELSSILIGKQERHPCGCLSCRYSGMFS